jgi:putative sigma-54 modulation protein
MNLNIDGQHIDVTPPLRDYVNKKFVRITEHFDTITTAHVVLSVEKLQQKAEIQLHLKGKELHASAIDNDMYAAIDAVMDKVYRQAIKHKEKLKSHKDNNNLDELD